MLTCQLYFAPAGAKRSFSTFFLPSPNHKQLKTCEHSNFALSFCINLTYFPENFKWFEYDLSVLSMFWWVRFFLCHPVIGCPLRQCSGQNSIFCNNPTSELIYGWKHCWYDVNTKMPQFYTFKIRLLWKPGKIAAMLDSQESKKRSQFWKFFNQILYLNWK